MTNSNKDIREKLKEEADLSLFKEIDFQAKHKEAIRKRLTTDPNDKNAKTSFFQAWRRPIYSVASLVAVLSLVFISTLFITNKSDISNPSPNVDSEGPFTTFVDELNEDNPAKQTTIELQTLEEASDLLGADILLPEYVPEPFEMETIVAIKRNGEEVPYQLNVTFVDKERAIVVQIIKNEFRGQLEGFEKADLGGITGQIKTEGSLPAINTELHWYREQVHYKISGVLTAKEAIQMAKSFK
jgi:hypothetical protein